MNSSVLSVTRKQQWQRFSVTLGMMGLLLTSPAIAQTQGQAMRTLTVTGQGTQRIPATLAEVQLGVEVQGQTATNVQQEVARRTSAVVELLRSQNVERLQTAGINLRPNYDYRDNQQRLIGYVGTNTVSFRLEAGQVGQLLDRVVQAGATRIDGINFTANDSAIATAQQQALRSATQDAQTQADAVLSALNLTRSEVVGIQINGAYSPPPQPLPIARQALMESAANAVTPVIGGEQAVNASVTLQIRY